MFGSKLRSWMEAVRPRKKQHRKEKNKNLTTTTNNWQNGNCCKAAPDELVRLDQPQHAVLKAPQESTKKNIQEPGHPPTRYSANNLSSPESAYSTGYSTDGTSPGAPPDYYINIRTDKYSHEPPPIYNGRVVNPVRPKLTPCASPQVPPKRQLMQTQEVVLVHQRTPVFRSPVLTSPRQRNRIRTNPWVPGSTLSPGQIRQELPKVTTTAPPADSPLSRRFLSPNTIRSAILRKQSLSSSSCSSLSGASVHWDTKKPSVSDEDDCTLNEMMGKYDESYVYERENDIISDSDPTDCDTDIDTGQDGGDEDEPLEGEFDFIDNGSYLEIEKEERNTGHCTYYNFDVQRKASRRRTTRRSKCSEKRRRSSSNKKRHKPEKMQMNGSKSAGATPLSVRRTKHHPTSKLAIDTLKKRSSSVSFSRDDRISTIDRRDKEADQKYRELIIEAEHILRSMKINGLSPRRVPGPANKRVEILRNMECAKPELFMKNRLIDEPPFKPSNNFNCPRFSPKKNHITNFMIHNSPVAMRRETELPKSPLAKRPDSPRRTSERRSPKYRKKQKCKLQDYSSDSDEGRNNLEFGCPQSEPVRRKVYSSRKTVAFNLNYENSPQEYKSSAENLRQQVLLNTIASLKRSLEDQSASLKQVYRSSHNLHL